MQKATRKEKKGIEERPNIMELPWEEEGSPALEIVEDYANVQVPLGTEEPAERKERHAETELEAEVGEEPIAADVPASAIEIDTRDIAEAIQKEEEQQEAMEASFPMREELAIAAARIPTPTSDHTNSTTTVSCLQPN